MLPICIPLIGLSQHKIVTVVNQRGFCSLKEMWQPARILFIRRARWCRTRPDIQGWERRCCIFNSEPRYHPALQERLPHAMQVRCRPGGGKQKHSERLGLLIISTEGALRRPLSIDLWWPSHPIPSHPIPSNNFRSTSPQKAEYDSWNTRTTSGELRWTKKN